MKATFKDTYDACQQFGFGSEITAETCWNEGYQLGRRRWYWGPAWFVAFQGWLSTQRQKIALAGVVMISCAFIGCAAFKNGAPPTAVESQLYNVRTNYLDVVVPRTNYVPVTVPVTNVTGVTVFQTNVVPVIVLTTNEVPQYDWSIKPGVTNIANAGSSVINTFFPGIGGLISTGLTALIGAWGYVRSSKNYNTSAALAQNVQIGRAFLQQLPNGQALDTAFTTFIQAHQADAGVLQSVLNLIENEVNNSDARDAALQIQSAITALSAQGPNPPSPATPAPPAHA